MERTPPASLFKGRALLWGSLFLAGSLGCESRAPSPAGEPSSAPSAGTPPSATPRLSAPSLDPNQPLLGIKSFVATVYKEPRDSAKKLGYLRLGAKVSRKGEAIRGGNCEAGWFEIAPTGFVCGEDATTDMNDPILRAARPPNLAAALPYRYAFVRAVLPLYLRVPTAEEQLKSEMSLKEHLEWYAKNSQEADRVVLGAPDVPIDERGVPLNNKQLGELGRGQNSTELPLGALFGGEGDSDPIPFWLADGKRTVPNVSDFKVPASSVFADRARRHTGLALIGSFPTGPESLNRRFAITTDLRLPPTSKLKADTGSPFHGVELSDTLTLPLAFVRSKGARALHLSKTEATPSGELQYRAVVPLSGTMRTLLGAKYYRTKTNEWVNELDVGLAALPSSFPEAAERGEKWIEVSIKNQTLVLWEGKRPIYATLVSTGQAGMADPKNSTATIRGTFRIRNKHITATMDSNESSSVGGSANVSTKGDDTKKPTSKAADAKKGKSSKSEAYVPRKGDGVYGVTRRRGEGTYQLRDVPYIQYFESGYALHAAYWHDVFGTPRSHGCINLSPVDAHRVFLWTEPQIPPGWHAINTGDEMGQGTTVIVHE